MNECTCKEDPITFLVRVYTESDEYSELAKLALLHFSGYCYLREVLAP